MAISDWKSAYFSCSLVSRPAAQASIKSSMAEIFKRSSKTNDRELVREVHTQRLLFPSPFHSKKIHKSSGAFQWITLKHQDIQQVSFPRADPLLLQGQHCQLGEVTRPHKFRDCSCRGAKVFCFSARSCHFTSRDRMYDTGG